MRPADTVYSARVDLPEHLRALRRQLGRGGSQAPPEVLGPVTALDELLAVLDTAIDGPGPPTSNSDRESLRDDVFCASKSMGTQLTQHLASGFRTLAPDVAGLDQSLIHPDSARAVRGNAQAFRIALLEPAAARAAWLDVLAAFERDEYAEVCEQRILQLREVVEARGHVWRTMRWQMEGLLNDDPAYMPDVEQPPERDPREGREEAGVPLSDRLLCIADAVSADAPEGDVIAWVAFQRACLDRSYMRVGRVEFFSHQLWPDALPAGNLPPEATTPAELLAESGEQLNYTDSIRGLPEDNFVLARVQLGHGPLAGVAERARELVEDIVHAALPGTGWQLMLGAATYLEGRGWNFNRFEDPSRYEVALDDPQYEPTSSELAGLDDRFVDALTRGEPAAVDVAEYVRWEVALRGVPDVGQRIVLSTRILERGLPGQRWNDAATRYLRDFWAERRLGLWLRDLALAVLSIHPGRWSDDVAETDAYTQLHDALTPSTGRLSFSFYADRAMRLLPPLVTDTIEGSVERRLLDELAERIVTGPETSDWLAEFESRFDRLLARTVRQRNAVIHGGGIVPAVLNTIEPFVAELVGRVVAEKVYAVGSGTPAEQAMEQVTHRVAHRRQRLRDGELAQDFLFQA